MQSLVLHIGTHKTGTTSIQRYLASRREELLRAGVLYPIAGCPARADISAGHHLLAWSVRRLPWAERRYGASPQRWSELLDEATSSGAHTVVVSSEEFDACSDAEVEEIARLVSGFDTTVVVYLRNQLDFVVSYYKEHVKSGYFRSFRSYLREILPLCDYGRLVDRWVGAFGRPKIDVRLFDRVKRERGLERDFLEDLVPDPDRLLARYPPGRANIGNPEELVMVTRGLNAIVHALGGGATARSVAHRVKRNLRDAAAGRALVALTRPFSRHPLCTSGDIEWLREATRRKNEDFLDRFVAPEDRRYLEF